MIANVNSSLFRLNNLQDAQDKLNFQMGGRQLQKGSDDSMLYGRLALVSDKIMTQTGIQDELNRTNVLNDNADSSIAEIKNLLDFIKSDLIKANTSTTSTEGLKAIAGDLEGAKQNLFDLGNTEVENQYVFAGSDASVKPFTMDDNGKVTYTGNDSLRKVAVDENSYREAGVNGLDLYYYTSSTALNGDTLTFDATDRITDQDGAEWTFTPTDPGDPTATPPTPPDLTQGGTLSKTNWDGSVDSIAVTGNSDGTLSANIDTITKTTPNGTTTTTGDDLNGVKFDAKKNIFDMLDNVINSLNGLDSDGNDTLTYDQQREGISNALTELDKAQDAVVIAHADLGGRNRTFNNASDLVSSKITQYKSLDIEIGDSNLTEVATNLKSLELMFSALYSTISQTNQLSLTNYMR